MDIAQEVLTIFNDDPDLLKKVRTGDESYVYGYDIETKAQSSQWKRSKEPKLKTARHVRSNVKGLVTVFFNCNGMMHHEFLQLGRTDNKEYYLAVIHRLLQTTRQKRIELWIYESWILHHDNAPTLTTMLVHGFLAKNKSVIILQLPYSPGLVPVVGFFSFPGLKTSMEGRRFAMIKAIKEKL